MSDPHSIDMFQFNNLEQYNLVSNGNDRFFLDLLISPSPKINVKKSSLPFIEEDGHHETFEIDASVNGMKELRSNSYVKYMLSRVK